MSELIKVLMLFLFEFDFLGVLGVLGGKLVFCITSEAERR
jgi:hypothetical protein